MLFSTPQFLLFFFFALAAIYSTSAVDRKFGLVAIVAVSLVFYGWFRLDYLPLLIGSALINFAFASAVTGRCGKWVMLAGVAANLIVLAAFKYADFAIGTLNWISGGSIALLHIGLPIAISFITFEQISFLSDVRSRRVSRGDLLHYLAFVTIFPKLIAGPIIRYREILPQLESWRAFDKERLLTGFAIFCIGLFKKVAIADALAKPVDGAVAELAAGNMLSRADASASLIGYSLQIYFDFSAYSEMALGIAWMIGIQLPVNFNSPYRARSLMDFWRRWHITLSSFLRDYLYIPLGGSRGGRLATLRNVFLVMVIGGLWHGAAWTFVAWGAIHGCALIVAHLLKEARAFEGAISGNTRLLLSWAASMLVVLVAWIFFRSPDFATAGRWIASLIAEQGVTHRYIGIPERWLIVALLTWVWLLPNVPKLFGINPDRDAIDWSNAPGIRPVSMRCTILASIAFVVSVILMFREPPNAFIYFQF